MPYLVSILRTWSPTRGWCHQDISNVTCPKRKITVQLTDIVKKFSIFSKKATRLYSGALFWSLVNHLLILFTDQTKGTSQRCPSPIAEDDNVVLHCNAIGNPVLSIARIKARSRTILSYNKTLIFRSITRSESGGYEWRAWNGIGNNSTNSYHTSVGFV